MSTKKFERIQTVEVGLLSSEQVSQWKSLCRRETRYGKLQRNLITESAEFIKKVEAYAQSLVPAKVSWRMRLSPKGVLSINFCPCVHCQAILNQVSRDEASAALRKLAATEEPLIDAGQSSKILDERLHPEVKTREWLN